MTFFSPSPESDTGVADGPRKRGGRKWLLRILGPVLFILLIRHFDYRHALRMIADLSPSTFLWALFLFLPLNLFKSARWSRILGSMGVKRGLGTLFNLNMASFGPSLLSPGRMAEFAKALPLVGHDCTAAVAFGSAVLDRLLDLFFVLVVGTGGILLILGMDSAPGLLLAIAAAAAVISLAIWFLPGILSVASMTGRLSYIAHAVQQVRRIPLGSWIYAFFLTVALWLSYFFSIKILAAGLNIPIGLGSVFLVFSSIAVLNLLPVSVAGIGTRDALLLVYFTGRGWQSEQAAALAGAVLALLLSEAVISLAYLTALTWFNPGKYGKQDTGDAQR